MLENIFTAVLNMGITASVAAIVIICIRLVLNNRFPKIFSYVLWSVILVRLFIPFSFSSIFSIFNVLPTPETTMTQSSQSIGTIKYIPHDLGFMAAPQSNTVNEALNKGINSSLPAATPEASINSMQIIISVATWIWLTGAIGLFGFGIFAYIRMSNRLKTAVLYKDNGLVAECSRKLKLKRKVEIFTSDKINTPVVCGLIKPRIILPLSLAQGGNETALKHIVIHELVHIKRFDYLIKPLSVLGLCVHWFNPVIWLSFVLSQKDMEMSCDERVMSVYDKDMRSEYAAALITLAAKQNVLLNGGLLAFGESNIKCRIKGIMNYTKPGFWLGAATIVLLIVLGLALLANGQYREVDKKGVIAAEDHNNKQLETAITEYYLSNQPGNKGILKIYNIIKYGNGYLALTKKYDGEGESYSILFLIDNGFKITAATSGNMPISPCFSANVVREQGKSIVFGNFKNKKWEPETDKVVDVHIDTVKITFEDGTVSKEPVSMDKGYIIVVDTLAKIKNIEVYNNKGELQSDLSETFYTEYSFSSTAKFDQNKVDNLLQEIMEHSPLTSSNPYDYVKDSKAFDELVAMGNPALKYMLESFVKSNENGLKEYIMACACAKIMGIFDEQKGIGVASGREWFYKYGAFEKDADMHIVDADFDLFRDSSDKPKHGLPLHTDMKNMEEVMANSILAINRRAYRMGEKAIEAHKIYRTEEKDGIINVYMMVSFQWFGFENGLFTVVSGGRGEPVRMQLKKQVNREYEVLEYKRAMDGGMWVKSIREMFPRDLAEVVIKGDEKTREELWDMHVIKARKYLEEINRTGAPVMPYVDKERAGEKAAKAIYLVTLMRHEFPDWNGTRENLVRAGGDYPGMKIRCVLETGCVSKGEGQYIITLTKTWDIKINGIQPVSNWKYKVTGEFVELIEEHDKDGMIRMIK